MRILILTLILQQFSILVFAQSREVRVQLYTKNPCTNTVEKLKSFFIIDDNGTVFDSFESKYENPIILPGFGRYSLVVPLNLESVLDINSDVYIDTLDTFTRVEPRLYSMHGPVKYYCCDSLCNGLVKDYWPNQNLKLEGRFDNGSPIDSLKTFRSDGTLETIEVYKPKELISLSYSEDGNSITWISHSTKNRSHTRQFEKGKVLLDEKRNSLKDWVKRKVYGSNGVLIENIRKRSYVKFRVENSKVLERGSRKRAYFFEEFCFENLLFWKRNKSCSSWKSFRYKIKLYTDEGKKSTLEVESWGSKSFEFGDSVLESDWISKLKVKEKGKWKVINIDSSANELSDFNLKLIKSYGFK